MTLEEKQDWLYIGRARRTIQPRDTQQAFRRTDLGKRDSTRLILPTINHFLFCDLLRLDQICFRLGKS